MIPEVAFAPGNRAKPRLLSTSFIFRRNPALGYGLGFAAFALALGLRFSLDVVIPRFPYLTFIPAVILTAFLAGTRAAVLCATLSFFSAWYWFVDPVESFSLNDGAIVGLGLFAFIIIVDIVAIELASRAVDELGAREALLSTIVETVPLGLVMAEFPSGRILGGNQYIERSFGHPVYHSPDLDSYGEWVGFHEDGSRVESHEYPFAAMMLRGEENPSIDVLRERTDGSRAWVRIMGRPVKDEAGRMTGGVVAIIDIDEQRRVRAALEEALKAKEILLYEVNHRVKNSLQLVNSFLLLEAAKISDPDAQSAVMAAREKVDLVANIHQLLYESGTHNGVDMQAAIRGIIHDLILSAGRHDVQLDLAFAGDLLVNIRQASPLVLLINEIITNALKHGMGSEKPTLNVAVSSTDGLMTLEIRDNGPGMTPEVPGQTPGLGSQIIEGLVAQMRGSIAVESDCTGTKITLRVKIDPPSPVIKDLG